MWHMRAIRNIFDAKHAIIRAARGNEVKSDAKIIKAKQIEANAKIIEAKQIEVKRTEATCNEAT